MCVCVCVCVCERERERERAQVSTFTALRANGETRLMSHRQPCCLLLHPLPSLPLNEGHIANSARGNKMCVCVTVGVWWDIGGSYWVGICQVVNISVC